MTAYRDFPANKEVTDVLFSIVSGHNTVKNIMRVLKQPQSTVSSKIQFLLKNKVITKTKWEFYPNWDEIHKIMYKILRKNSPLSVQFYIKSVMRDVFGLDDAKIKQLQDVLANIELYFPKFRLERMICEYAKLFTETKEKASIQDIINKYFVGLLECEKSSLKKKDPYLYKLATIMKLPSQELIFFKRCEV